METTNHTTERTVRETGGQRPGKRNASASSARRSGSWGNTNRTAAHWHREGDLFAVSERAAIDRDVVDLLSGCWGAQAGGLEDPTK